MSLVLVAPPWPLFNRPSIQVGALKAWLLRAFPGLRVKAYHPYIDLADRLGYLNYHRISQSSWAAESVYGALIFPEKANEAEALFYSSLKRREKGPIPPFAEVCKQAEASAEAFLSSVHWPKVELVGISVCLNQFTAGLYLASRVKTLSQQTAVLMGGSSVSGGVARSLLNAFSYLDFIIDGEGELPLQGLVEFLAGKRTELPKAVYAREGLFNRENEETHKNEEKDIQGQKLQVKDLDQLPIPDYHDYFKEFSRLSCPPNLSITLPVEASRGCWWSKCNFCNLNLQWDGYRSKCPERISKEIEELSQRYQILDFALMDNCLPPKDAKKVFGLLAKTGLDLKLFCELRAVHGREEYRQFKAGGLKYLQVGIEALSTSLLKRMRKGAATIDNLAALKHAAENGIEIGANLITRFPGSTRQEAAETLTNLEFAWPFAPLKAVPFWLGRMSPVFCNPKHYGIIAMSPARQYRQIFPEPVLQKLDPLIFDWRGDRTLQAQIWRPVERETTKLSEARRQFSEASLLTWREGKSFITINQRLPDGAVLNHRLSGISRRIYLAAQDIVSIEVLKKRFSNISPQKLETFISDLVKKRLMFKEGKRVLSLATRGQGQHH